MDRSPRTAAALKAAIEAAREAGMIEVAERLQAIAEKLQAAKDDNADSV